MSVDSVLSLNFRLLSNYLLGTFTEVRSPKCLKMSRREFFTTAHKPAPPAYFGGWRMRLYNCFSWGWEPLNYLSWTVGCFVLVFKKLFFDFFFFRGVGRKVSNLRSVRQHILSALPTTFSRIWPLIIIPLSPPRPPSSLAWIVTAFWLVSLLASSSPAIF